MNYKNDLKILSYIFLAFGICLLAPIGIALYNGEGRELGAFAITALISIALFAILFFSTRRNLDNRVRLKDGFFIVSATWVLICVLASLPFIITKDLPDFPSAFFEVVSGFTTTGTTVFGEVEGLGKSTLFYRSLCSFLGGMGVVGLFVALMPNFGSAGLKLTSVESVGLSKDKLLPKARESAKSLWLTYIIVNLALIVVLCILGLGFFDSVCIALSTIATSGFATKNTSITHYNDPVVELVIAIFMFVSSLSFSLIYLSAIKKKPSILLLDRETMAFCGIVALTTLAVAESLHVNNCYGSFWECLRKAFFHESSIISTTGFNTADVTEWPLESKLFLFLSYFVGGCQGSTSGGVKVVRWCIVYKLLKSQVRDKMHSRSVSSLQFNGSVIEDKTIREITAFIFIYFLIVLVSSMLISLDAAVYNIENALDLSLLSMGNIGLSLTKTNIAILSPFSKMVLSVEMLLGRLEVFPFLMLFRREFWRR